MASTVTARALAEQLGSAWQREGQAATGLAEAIRALVVDGRLAVRTRVPSERDLAAELALGRGTVSRAYDRLREEGFLESARGAGSRLTVPHGRGPAAVPLPTDRPDVIDLTFASLPGPEPVLSDAAAAAARRLAGHAPSLGYAPAGLPELRDAVAARFRGRGLPTGAEHIMVTAGAQHALALVLQLHVGPGDRVLVDAPAYPRTLGAIRAVRARPVAVPLTDRGWDAEAWEHTLAAAAPRVAVTIPDFHNPTGLTMTGAQRAAIARACARAGTVLVVDETNTELRLDGAPLPEPAAAHDPGVVTLGTLSKAAWGGLRIGWIRAAPRVIDELTAVRAELDMASPVLDQLLAAELLERFDEVVANRRALLKPRRAALLDALAGTPWTLRKPRGGLSAWIRLAAPHATRLAAAADEHGIQLAPGPAFSVDGTFEHHVRIPFTQPPERLQAAVATLRRLEGRLGPAAAAPRERVPATV